MLSILGERNTACVGELWNKSLTDSPYYSLNFLGFGVFFIKTGAYPKLLTPHQI